MLLRSIYNIPLFNDNYVVTVTRNNECFIAEASQLAVVSRHKFSGFSQLWPIKWDGELFFQSDSSIYRLTGETLEPVWNRGISSTLPNGRVLEREGGTWNNKLLKLRCFDVNRRELLWNIESESLAIVSPSDKLLLISDASRTYQQLRDLDTGKIKWTFESGIADQELILGSVGEDWLTLQGTLRREVYDHQYRLYKIDLFTGKVIWCTETPFRGYKYDTVRDQFIGFGGGRLSVLDGASGKILADGPQLMEVGPQSGQQSPKIALNPGTGKLVFDVSSENTVIGVYDYVNQKLKWLSSFAEKGTTRVGRVWFNDNLIHIFDSTNTLRIGRDEGNHLQML